MPFDSTHWQARHALLADITAQTRAFRKQDKSLEDLEDWLITHQTSIIDGPKPPRQRPSRARANPND